MTELPGLAERLLSEATALEAPKYRLFGTAERLREAATRIGELEAALQLWSDWAHEFDPDADKHNEKYDAMLGAAVSATYTALFGDYE